MLCLLALFLLRSHGSAQNLEKQCDIGVSLRKQVKVEPLNGTCLVDIVSKLSVEFLSISEEELALTYFQRMLDQTEFMNVSRGFETTLDVLVDKLNNKLGAYAELLHRTDSIVQPIFKRKDNFQKNICEQIMTALATTTINAWKNIHIFPISHPSCGAPLTHILLSRCHRKVLLLMERRTFPLEADTVLAQMAAESIIDMLSQRDYVNVVDLSNNSIYSEGLIKATDINRFLLVRYVRALGRAESSDAVDFSLNNFTQSATEIVFIHLTNTLKPNPHVTKIKDMISLGEIKGNLKTILILSDQEVHETYMEDVLILPTQNILVFEIAKLFSNLKCLEEHKKDYYISDPYFELYSKTMIVSIGKITDEAVFSLDVKLRDFVEDITYFNAGPNVYAILFDNEGIVWMHKNFPRVEMMIDQPLRVYLKDIENISEIIVNDMIKQNEGTIAIDTNSKEKKWYRWKHLNYKDLIVCVISTITESVLPIAKLVPILPNILHHRLDLLLHTMVDKDILCNYQNRLMTLSTGVLYLSPWCFQSPMEQLKLLEIGSAVTVQSYMAYIKDLTGLLANPGLHQSVRPDVLMLAQILDYFKSRHAKSPLNKFIIRRYVVSTISGVLQIYPGTVLDSTFDPKHRVWYTKALEFPDKLILTPPYLDAAGSGYVISLSITKSVNNYLSILSLDVGIGYLSRLLKELFPFCKESNIKCFLMDDKGYLVSHPSLLEATGKIEQHLTHKELLVANDILNHELFVQKKSCVNYLEGTVQRYYQFNTSLDEVLTNIVHGEHCVKYQVAAVPGSNVFLGVVNVTCNLLRAFCPCSTMDRSCLNCKRMEQTECECPCECPMYASYSTPANLPHCPPPPEQGGIQPWRPTGVKPCPSIDCSAYATEDDCLGVVGCQWCYLDGEERELERPFCTEMAVCFRGIFGSFIPHSDGTYNSQSTDVTRPSVGPVAGGVLALLLILGLMLFCYRLRNGRNSEHQCLHTPPDTLRVEHEERTMDLRERVPSPYKVPTSYRPPAGDSDHGYSTMTPHEESEQMTFVEPLLVMVNKSESASLQPSTCLGGHSVLAPVTVHRHMETNYC